MNVLALLRPARPAHASTVLPSGSRPPASGRRAVGALVAAAAACGAVNHVAGPSVAEPLAALVAVAAAVRMRARPALLVTAAAAATASPMLPWLPASRPQAAWAASLVALPLVAQVVARLDRDRTQLAEQLAVAMTEAKVRDEQVAVEREQLTSQLEFWVTHDAMTGLPNRAMFARAVTDAIGRGDACGVLMLSLADFTAVNTAFGTGFGDEVLVAVARRLEAALRTGDVVARVGGDEFGVLISGLQASDAQSAGDRIVRVFTDQFSVAGHRVGVNARAGLALVRPGEGVDALELLRRADVAVAAADPHGEVNVFALERQQGAVERARLEADMRRGLEAGEFFCVYQPLVSGVDGRIASIEALARWQHPERGLVGPAEFIPVAERCGLIVPLGLAMLEQACRQLRAWRDLGATHLTVAVNLSARQLAEPGIVESVSRVLWSSGVDPRHVVLEITESLLVEDGEAAIRTLWQLRGLGIRLAVDDFGTGYSSLSRLDEMPIDEMKIDKSFVDRVGAATKDSSAIIAGAVAMGHALGLSVVAEGVETHKQAEFLCSVECDLLQGYLLGRPQGAESIRDQLSHPIWDVTGTGRRAVPDQRHGDPASTPLMPVAAPPR